jgi:DNA-binding MurR/RpiR family transcriptional regulator
MEIRIGITQTAKEITADVDGKADDLIAQIDAALAGGSPVVWITDKKGRRIGAPAAKIAYVEIDEDGDSKRVGFGR